MSEESVLLVAEEHSFEVPRKLLADHSLYFSAALTSGMCESETGRFVFPNLSARQLSLVVQCAHSKFTSWPFENSATELSPKYRCLSLPSASDSDPHCSVQNELDALLTVIEAADYLQIALLIRTCLARLSTVLDHLFSPLSIVDHLRHDCQVFSTCLEAWVKVSQVQDKSFAKLFQQYASLHPDLILKPYMPQTELQSAVLELTTCTLRSDLLCVPDESVVLDLVLGWLNVLNELGLCEQRVVEALFDSVRPGLLSFEARARLHAWWSVHYPQAKWQQQLDCVSFSTLMRHIPYQGPFASIRCNVDREEPPGFFESRASTPVLITLAPSFGKNTVELSLFNLLNGELRSLDIPTCHLTKLVSESVTDGDFDGHIYLCHPSIHVQRHKSLLVVLYHNPYACTVNGFMWCLATCQADWLPSLVLPAVENRSAGVTISSCFRSRRIGVATLPTGLHVYCAEPSNSEIWLHLFRFDVSLWQWHLRASKSLFTNPSTGIALFTSVDPLGLFSPDGWMYANVEFADRSDPREARIRRHNLHQTSHVRSHFFRFRPGVNGLVVESLPSPPFLIRIYRMLALCDPSSGSTPRQTYLFAFGTCSRDQTATHFCFNTETHQWVEWKGTNDFISNESRASSTDVPIRSSRPKLQVNLCPEMLGFRGLVSTSYILNGIPKQICDPTDDSDEEMDRSSQSNDTACVSHNMQQQHRLVNPTLVLIGRPDYHLSENKSSASGIWFHRPRIGPIEDGADAFEPRKPAFPLPSSLAQMLHQLPAPAAVLVANWDNLIRSTEILRFGAPYPEAPVSKSSTYEPLVTCPFPGLNYSWSGWTASDSD